MEIEKKDYKKYTETFFKGFKNEYSVEMVENPNTGSPIKAIGYYDHALFVKFGTGIYKYAQVPKKLYDEFITADSWGGFFANKVKPDYGYDYDYLK